MVDQATRSTTSRPNDPPPLRPAENVTICLGGEGGLGFEMAPFKDGFVPSVTPRVGFVFGLNCSNRLHPMFSVGGQFWTNPLYGGVTKGGVYAEARLGGRLGNGPINFYGILGGSLSRIQTDLRNFEITVDGETESVHLVPHTQTQLYLGAELAIRKTTKDGSIVEFFPFSFRWKPLASTLGTLPDGTIESMNHPPLAFEGNMGLRVTTGALSERAEPEDAPERLQAKKNGPVSKTETPSEQGTTLTIEGDIVIPDNSRKSGVDPRDKAAQETFSAALEDDSITRIIIDGHLTVRKSRLTDLSLLEKVVEVKGHLYVENNAALISLKGLQNLERVGGDFFIKYNPQLRDFTFSAETEDGGSAQLSALGSLISVGNHLNIISNENLEEIDGINNLIEVGELFIISNYQTGDTERKGLKNIRGFNRLVSIKGSLSIRSNLSLEGIYGFSNLVFVNTIKIQQNNHLQRIEAFDKLKRLVGQLKIEGNTDLGGIYNFTPYFIYGLMEIASSQNKTWGAAITIQNNPTLNDFSFLNSLQYADPKEITIIVADQHAQEQVQPLLGRLGAISDSGLKDDYEAKYLFELLQGDEDDFVRQKALETYAKNIEDGAHPQENTLLSMATFLSQIIMEKGQVSITGVRPFSDGLLSSVIFHYCNTFEKYDRYNRPDVAKALVENYFEDPITAHNLGLLIKDMSNPTLLEAYRKTIALQDVIPQQADPKIQETYRTGLETLKKDLADAIEERNLRIPKKQTLPRHLFWFFDLQNF